MNSVAKHARFSAKTQYTALNHKNTFLLLRRDEKISAGEMYNCPLTLGRRVWIVQQRNTAIILSAHRTPPSTLSSLSHKRIVVRAGGLDLKEPKNGGVMSQFSGLLFALSDLALRFFFLLRGRSAGSSTSPCRCERSAALPTASGWQEVGGLGDTTRDRHAGFFQRPLFLVFLST